MRNLVSGLVLILCAFAAGAQVQPRPASGNQVSSVSGNGHTIATTNGPLTPGDGILVDANGNLVDSGLPALGGGSNYTIATGDSICALGEAAPNNLFDPRDWVSQAYILSKGSLVYLYNQCVSGNTSAQVLARISTVVALKPAIVVLGVGTNDVNTSVPTATTLANVSAILSALLQGGIRPILAAVPPSNTTAVVPSISALNIAYRGLAAQLGIPFADTHHALAQANGTYISAMTSDGTHPNDAGALAMAQVLVNALNQSGAVSHSAWQPWSPDDGTSSQTSGGSTGINLIQNATFAGTFSGTTPQFWNVSTNTATSTTASLVAAVTADNLNGNWWTIVKTDATDGHNNEWYQNVPSTAFSVENTTATAAPAFNVLTVASAAGVAIGQGVTATGVPPIATVTAVNGTSITISLPTTAALSATAVTFSDRVAVSARVRASSIVTDYAFPYGFDIKLSFAGSSLTTGMFEWSQNITDGLVYVEAAIPSGTTQLTLYVDFYNGTGTFQLGQVGVVNLTTNSVIE